MINSFWVALKQNLAKYCPPLREGQCYFNTLYEVNPELANEIRGTNIDPFYLDSRIDAFVDFLDSQGVI